MPGLIRIVLAGGQTGVDRAAHRAAMASGILCAGWCPPGRMAEDGSIQPEFPLTQTPVERSEQAPGIARSLRTEWNVRDSDGVLILRPADAEPDPGTEWTERTARLQSKPMLVLDPDGDDAVPVAIKWLQSEGVHILNVAGPSERSCPGIGDAACRFLSELFARTATET